MSSDPEVVIHIRDLSKCYHIFEHPRDRLLQMLFRGRRRYYKEFWALRPMSLDIRRGETVALIGRNGSGKSTLLQLICGTLNTTGGTLETRGRVAALLELGSGFNPEFTGRENVYMNASMLGLTQEEIEARYDDIVAFADIGEFIDQPVKTYSSGMYVRLAFAVVAHVDADILIIDEALAVGDAVFTQKCMRFLRGFQENGTILFVSHDMGAVISLCTHAYWLDQGKLRMSGKPKDVAEAYLASNYEALQGASQVHPDPDPDPDTDTNPDADPGTQEDTANGSAGEAADATTPNAAVLRDMREDFINASNLRNDLQLFEFSDDAPAFGAGGARITLVQLCDPQGRPLSWVVGGEQVVLQVQCKTRQALFSPIIGFSIKDRLGQVLFGDNTYLAYLEAPLHVDSETVFSAQFAFRMPILPKGDYSINVAIAEGNQQVHVQHHWIHDAILFQSVSSSVATGLVGIPMESIRMDVLSPTQIEQEA